MCETWLKRNDSIVVNGYEWIGNNNKRARRASGGVGMLIAKSFLIEYTYQIMELKVEVNLISTPVLIAGDFNARTANQWDRLSE